MKKIALMVMSVIILIASGCNVQKNNDLKEKVNISQNITAEEMRKIDLYVTAMKGAFKEENGGNDFIAVKMNTLDGLSQDGKQEVLKKLKDLSDHVYPFEDIESDSTKFEQDERGNLVRSINGTLLSVRVEELSDNKAIIEATSWFGNLGAVFPKYKATYKNDKWNLELISMAVS